MPTSRTRSFDLEADDSDSGDREGQDGAADNSDSNSLDVDSSDFDASAQPLDHNKIWLPEDYRWYNHGLVRSGLNNSGPESSAV